MILGEVASAVAVLAAHHRQGHRLVHQANTALLDDRAIGSVLVPVGRDVVASC